VEGEGERERERAREREREREEGEFTIIILGVQMSRNTGLLVGRFSLQDFIYFRNMEYATTGFGPEFHY
jgi:hypothetical protein